MAVRAVAPAAESWSIWRRVSVEAKSYLLVCLLIYLLIQGILDDLFRFRIIHVKFIEKRDWAISARLFAFRIAGGCLRPIHFLGGQFAKNIL